MNSDSRDSDEVIVFDFGTTANMDGWLVVNDGVMGGLSNSRIILSDSNTLFSQGMYRWKIMVALPPPEQKLCSLIWTDLKAS